MLVRLERHYVALPSTEPAPRWSSEDASEDDHEEGRSEEDHEGHGTALEPVPPVTPIGMGKSSRGVDLESVDAIDERQIASWMKQITAIPGFGKKR